MTIADLIAMLEACPKDYQVEIDAGDPISTLTFEPIAKDRIVNITME